VLWTSVKTEDSTGKATTDVLAFDSADVGTKAAPTGTITQIVLRVKSKDIIMLDDIRLTFATNGDSNETKVTKCTATVCNAADDVFKEGTCKRTTCTHDECCSPRETCADFEDECGAGSKAKEPKTVCAGDACTSDDCCEKSPVVTPVKKDWKYGKWLDCSGGVCGGKGKQSRTAQCWDYSKEKTTSAGFCQKKKVVEQDCDMPVCTCLDFKAKCGVGREAKALPVTCAGDSCTLDDCCKKSSGDTPKGKDWKVILGECTGGDCGGKGKQSQTLQCWDYTKRRRPVLDAKGRSDP
jgi:hypothetical protein